MSFGKKPKAVQAQKFFYAVGVGRTRGVFNTWADIQPLVNGIQNARYKKFTTYQEAQAFVDLHASPVKSYSPYKPTTPPVTPPQSGKTFSRPSPGSLNQLQVKSREMSRKFDGSPNSSCAPNLSPERCLSSSYPSSSQDLDRTQPVASTSYDSQPCSSSQQLHGFKQRLEFLENDLNKFVGEKTIEIAKLKQDFATLQSKASTEDDKSNNNSKLDKTLKRLQERNEEQESSNPQKRTRLIDAVPDPPLGEFSGASSPQENKPEIDFSYDDKGYCIVYTDGACINNGRSGAKAGIGVWFGPNHPLNVGEPLINALPTNNNAEIQAVTFTLNLMREAGVEKVSIHTDSQFVINCATQWMDGWMKKGWKKSDGKPVVNKDQLQLLHDARQGLDVQWVHVKGHSNILGNEMADRLANEGAAKFTPSSQ